MWSDFVNGIRNSFNKIINEIRFRGSFEIKETKRYGKGVYAKRDFKKGEFIWLLDGEEIAEVDCDKMVVDGLINNDDPLQISRDKYLLLDEFSRTFNHSCDPNAALKYRSTMFAIKDIKKGEEITYDYSVLVPPYNHTFTTMNNCVCGSAKCRKSLGNISTMPKEIIGRYKKNGALQDFILEALQEDKFLE